jgi:hypothetical protein
MGELAILALCLTVCFVVSLLIIHKQTLSARSLQAYYTRQARANFENQWRLWNKDRQSSNQAITSLAAWNAKLCESNAKTVEQVQALLKATEARLMGAFLNQLEQGFKQVAESVGKTSASP